MYSTEIDDRVVWSASPRKARRRARAKAGDVILAVEPARKSQVKPDFTASSGHSGPPVWTCRSPFYHGGVTFDVVAGSTDRARLLKAPRMH